MIYIDCDYKEYAEKYQIYIEPESCPKCECPIDFNIPFAMNGYRGLEASKCSECGHDSGMFRIVPVDDSTIDFWELLRPK